MCIRDRSRNGTIAGQPVSGLFIEMKTFPQWSRKLPGKAALDPVQLEIQLFDLFLTFLYLAYEDFGFLPLSLVQFCLLYTS